MTEKEPTLYANCVKINCSHRDWTFWPDCCFTIKGKYGTTHSDTMSSNRCVKAIQDALDKIQPNLGKTCCGHLEQRVF